MGEKREAASQKGRESPGGTPGSTPSRASGGGGGPGRPEGRKGSTLSPGTVRQTFAGAAVTAAGSGFSAVASAYELVAGGAGGEVPPQGTGLQNGPRCDAVLIPQAGRHDPSRVVSDFDRWPAALLAVLPQDFPRPARAVRRVRPDGPVGSHFSRLMLAPRHYESACEGAAALLLDVDPTVWGYWAQPATLSYVLDGVERRATPDLLVRFADGSFAFVEVKLRRRLIADARRLRAVAAAAAGLGVAYLVLADDRIFAEPRLANARHLFRAFATPVTDGMVRHVREAVSAPGTATLGDLQAHPALRGFQSEAVLACGLWGAFSLDTDGGALGPHTAVRVLAAGTGRRLVEWKPEVAGTRVRRDPVR